MNNTEIIKHIIETMISVSEHTDKDFEAAEMAVFAIR